MTLGKTLKLNQGVEEELKIKVGDNTFNPSDNTIDLTDKFSEKQDVITDLQTIRDNASHGETAYQQLSGVETLLEGI